MFARFVRLFSTTILCVHGKFSRVPITAYHVFHWLAKTKIAKRKKCVTAPILKPTYVMGSAKTLHMVKIEKNELLISG